MQNPPCIPLLLVLVILKVTGLSKSKLIIDWHNYGYSIMKVNRVNKALVFLGKVYEMRLGKFADHNLCVSDAMRTNLIHFFGLKKSPPHVLYDKATKKFGDVSIEEKHKLFKKIGFGDKQDENKTLFTVFD